MKIIIDTDPGQDDALALILACSSKLFTVMAVTTVAGNTTLKHTTNNAQFILDFIQRSDIPLFSGGRKPLKRTLIQAVVHGKTGLEGIDTSNVVPAQKDAVPRILQLLKQHPNQITLVALGPLTNIAQAIIADPATMKLAKQIVFMGGAIAVAGNKNRVAEFNIFVDPEAADIVMQSDIKKVMVPLDACNHIQMPLRDFRRIKNTSLQNLLLQMMQPYIKNLQADTGVSAALMYDPLTIYYLMKPELCRVSSFNIQIETTSELTRGMTVADRRTINDGATPNAQVVMHIDEHDFIETFVTSLNSAF